ncbi:hypothetical protein D3C78_832430 [compost metagenome]
MVHRDRYTTIWSKSLGMANCGNLVRGCDAASDLFAGKITIQFTQICNDGDGTAGCRIYAFHSDSDCYD